MILNCIFDERRPEKLPLLEAEMLRQGISYCLWSAEILPNVVESINASHRKIIQYALDNGLPEIAIAEDDVFFPADDGWKYFLSGIVGIPKSCDIYLAGTYLPQFGTSCGKLDKLSENNYNHIGCQVEKIVGLHCYIIYQRFYDTFLSMPKKYHIDTALDHKGKFIVRTPMAAVQRPGWSANNKKIVDYNELLTDKDVYGGLPKKGL